MAVDTATAAKTATAKPAATATTTTATTTTTTTTTATITTATITTATAATAEVQVEKDKFRKELDEAEGDTVLLSMCESKKPCQLKGKNAAGQDVHIDLAGMTTAQARGGQDMTLTAWIGTGITRVDRKVPSAINYIARIVKKADIQTWSEAEKHLWEEYEMYWNTPKHNA